MFKAIKLGVLILALSFPIQSFSQTNATAASPVDCNGTTHDLFAEMDAGKIIVIGWTMPCATCASPLLDVHNAVLNYAVSNPGVVEYWLTDDFANTNCSSIEGWCTTNGISNAIYFSSSELDMDDYGGAGMPKVVVVGCMDHKVYYNRNNAPSGSGVTTAVDEALSDIAASCQLSTEELESSTFALECYPNPASSEMTVSFKATPGEILSMEVIDLKGAILKQVDVEKIGSGAGNVALDLTDMNDGFYFLKMMNGRDTEVIKFQVLK